MKSNYEIAKEVLDAKWGNGAERRERITAAGYNYEAVQSIVNAIVYDNYKPEQEEPAPAVKTLEIDYDPELYQGITINIIV
jgi:hypothetical protein